MSRGNKYSICVIGNSHTAAFKQAWDNRAPAVADGVSLTFFAARSQNLTALAYEPGVFVSRDADLSEKLRLTSGGKDRIELADYDAFVLIGMGYRFTINKLCGTYGTVEHQSWGPVEKLVSRACFAAMIDTLFNDNPADALLRQIGSFCNAPVLICPTPYRTAKFLDKRHMREHSRLSERAFFASIMKQIEASGSRAAARHGGEVVWQDENTTDMPGFTKPKFSEGALRLVPGEGRNADNLHMNEEFGFHVLTAVLNRLNDISGGRVLAETPAAKQKTARRAAAPSA